MKQGNIQWRFPKTKITKCKIVKIVKKSRAITTEETICQLFKDKKLTKYLRCDNLLCLNDGTRMFCVDYAFQL